MKRIIIVLAMVSTMAMPGYGQESSARFGIEIPFSQVTTDIDLPRLMMGRIQKVEGGTKYDIGVGMTYQNSGHFNFRTGFHLWKVPFKPTVNRVEDDDKSYVRENGLLTYYGIYLRGEFGNKYFFIGGGFDFSLANEYKADRAYYENDILIGTEKNQNSSVLTDDFNNIFNITVNTGFKIPIQNRYIIKPFVSLGTSFSSIYPTDKVTNIGNTGVSYTTPQKVDLQYTSILGYGISLEYKF
jgi:hypothetical protein